MAFTSEQDKPMHKKSMVLAASALALSGAPALANNYCNGQVAPYRTELETKTAPAFAEINKGIDIIRKGNGDPDKVAFKMSDGTFKTLPELLQLLTAQKADASKQIDDAADKCASGLKPLQDATDAYVAIATGGLSELLPKRMMHIEIGEILAGKPFGGDGGLVPHFREQILDGLGLKNDNGFVVQFIRDPLHAVFPHL